MTSSHWQRINYADQHVQRLARCLSYIIFLAFANGENRTHNLFVLSAPSQMIVSQVTFLLFVTLSSSTTDCTVILRSCGRSCFSLQSPVTNWRRLEVYSNITTQFMYYYYIFHNFLAWDQSSKSIYLFSMIVIDTWERTFRLFDSSQRMSTRATHTDESFFVFFSSVP